MPLKQNKVNVIYRPRALLSCSVKSDKKERKRGSGLFFARRVGKLNLLYYSTLPCLNQEIRAKKPPTEDFFIVRGKEHPPKR